MSTETKKCPSCGEKVWDTSTPDQRLNKCWNCGTRFDNPEPEEEENVLQLTLAQQQAINKLRERFPDMTDPIPLFCDGSVGVWIHKDKPKEPNAGNMFIGIEKDGYSHT